MEGQDPKELTLALAFLQFVQAFGVTESGTFRFLPVLPLEVPGLAWPDDVSSEPVGIAEDPWLSGGDCWISGADWPDEPVEVSVEIVSERVTDEWKD